MKKLSLPEFIVIAVGILLLGFLIISTVYGADGPGQMTIFCTAPTKNTNGTTLTDLTGFRFIADNKIIANSPSCPYQFSGLTPGPHSFVVRAVTPEPPPDDISDPAGPLTATVLGTGLTNQDGIIYRFVQNLGSNSQGDAVMIQAGTIPTGSSCDQLQTMTTHGTTYYRVDRTLVTFSGNNKPPTVWSICK